MKKQKVCSAPNKETLEKLINEFYFSDNYKITDDNKLNNTRFTEDRVLDINNKTLIEFKKNRWSFYLIKQ